MEKFLALSLSDVVFIMTRSISCTAELSMKKSFVTSGHIRFKHSKKPSYMLIQTKLKLYVPELDNLINIVLITQYSKAEIYISFISGRLVILFN